MSRSSVIYFVFVLAAVNFTILSDDYSKVSDSYTCTLPESSSQVISPSTAQTLCFLQFVLLLSDRHLEFHAQVSYMSPGY